MKRVIVYIACLWVGITCHAISGELSAEKQQDLIDQMLYLRGEGPRPASIEEKHHTCGTQTAFNFFMNRDNLTGKLASDAQALFIRPANICYLSVTTPANRFRVHYTDTSINAVYMVNVDSVGYGGALGADGIPDYVNKIADISDSVWTFVIDSLGYPEPWSDGTGGGDSLTDVYIVDLGSSYYGVTYADTSAPFTNYSIATWIELDNDYDLEPYNTGPDGDTMERRLDAARVTMAHEFFHMIHFTMDRTEVEYQGYEYYLPWWEMTSTWMEEMVYDSINDYYFYLDNYYEYPWIGLRTAFGFSFHQYASCIFPIYLTEKFDRSIILDIWQKCRDYGLGSQFPQAINDAIVESSSSDLGIAFNEFAVWNYFTGSRAAQAPSGVGFSEGANYPEILDNLFLTFNSYDSTSITVPWPDTLLNGISIEFFKNNQPQDMAAHYLKFENLSQLSDSGLVITLLGDRDMTWDISIIGFPFGQAEAVITSYSPEQSEVVKDTIFADEFSHAITVLSPTSTSMPEFTTKYAYVVRFQADTLISSEASFSISAPYPNPVRIETDDASVTFVANIDMNSPGKEARIYVTLFNTAGEKINVIESKPVFGYRGSPIEINWGLNNKSNQKVAPGVYLAHVKLIFSDGTETHTENMKVAVIR